MSIEKGTALVKHWAPRFGLGEFRLKVKPMPTDNTEAWALSHYDIEEMWGSIELPSDEVFPFETLELLVLHELAHGLLQLAGTDVTSVAVEQSCNRIARLTRGDFESRLMNEEREAIEGDAYYNADGKDRTAASRLDRRKWLAIVTDGLPEAERQVITLLYFEGVSMRDAGEVLGCDVHTVFRRRNSALARLQQYYEALDASPMLGNQ